MPTHEGIQFQVLSQIEFAVHPEFPHPESSQFTFRSPGRKIDDDLDRGSPSISGSSKADLLLGRNPMVSVYIPSAPGAQFWLRYHVSEFAVAQSQWYYFKLLMNGRHIASWGIDASESPSGQVMQGLFDPSSRWNYEQGGEIWKNNGLEKRAFFFAKEGDEHSSVVNDGGLIEVQCFRATGRQRKIPEPEEWREQPNYGIVAPSSGLYENPSEAKFYDWHLKDAKKSPFINFRFHYRSWESLAASELIPAGFSRTMARYTREHVPEELEAILEPKADLPFLNNPHTPCKTCVEPIPFTPMIARNNHEDDVVYNEDVEDWAEDEEVHEVDGVENLEKIKCSGSPTSKFAVNIAAPRIRRRKSIPSTPDFNKGLPSPTSAEGSPQQRGTHSSMMDGLTSRPLPQIPVRKSSRNPHSRRTSSVNSRAPSLTPSLLQYIERESMTSPEPVEIGVATMVDLRSASPKPPSLNSDSDVFGNSEILATPPKMSAFEHSVMTPSIEVSSPSSLLPPSVPVQPRSSSLGVKRKPMGLSNSLFKRRIFTSPAKTDPFSSPSLPNTSIRKAQRSMMKLTRSNTGFTSIASSAEQSMDGEDNLSLDELKSLSISEAEWMRRTPSLNNKERGRSRLPRDSLDMTDSPTPLSKKEELIENFNKHRNAWGRSSFAWSRKTRSDPSSVFDENSPPSTGSVEAAEPKVPDGGWI